MIKHLTYSVFVSSLLFFSATAGSAQSKATNAKDSIPVTIVTDSIVPPTRIDSAILVIHSPRKAAIRSAILPGWGQAYNKKYWKIPIVYAALGTSAGIFIYNVTWYRRFRDAYRIVYNHDTANYDKIHPRLESYRRFDDHPGLRYNRDEFRRNVDYSAVAFIILWGLNVVDATVDAHLKTFDVSPDLSLRIAPGYSEMAGTNGISLVLSLK